MDTIEQNNTTIPPVMNSQIPENRHPQWIVFIMLVVALLAVAGALSLLKKAPPSRADDPVVQGLKSDTPPKTLSEQEKSVIINKLKDDSSKPLSNTDREKILNALKQ